MRASLRLRCHFHVYNVSYIYVSTSIYAFVYICVFKEVDNLRCIFIHFQMLDPNVTQFTRYKINMIWKSCIAVFQPQSLSQSLSTNLRAGDSLVFSSQRGLSKWYWAVKIECPNYMIKYNIFFHWLFSFIEWNEKSFPGKVGTFHQIMSWTSFLLNHFLHQHFV